MMSLKSAMPIEKGGVPTVDATASKLPEKGMRQPERAFSESKKVPIRVTIARLQNKKFDTDTKWFPKQTREQMVGEFVDFVRWAHFNYKEQVDKFVDLDLGELFQLSEGLSKPLTFKDNPLKVMNRMGELKPGLYNELCSNFDVHRGITEALPRYILGPWKERTTSDNLILDEETHTYPYASITEKLTTCPIFLIDPHDNVAQVLSFYLASSLGLTLTYMSHSVRYGTRSNSLRIERNRGGAPEDDYLGSGTKGRQFMHSEREHPLALLWISAKSNFGPITKSAKSIVEQLYKEDAEAPEVSDAIVARLDGLATEINAGLQICHTAQGFANVCSGAVEMLNTLLLQRVFNGRAGTYHDVVEDFVELLKKKGVDRRDYDFRRVLKKVSKQNHLTAIISPNSIIDDSFGFRISEVDLKNTQAGVKEVGDKELRRAFRNQNVNLLLEVGSKVQAELEAEMERHAQLTRSGSAQEMELDRTLATGCVLYLKVDLQAAIGRFSTDEEKQRALHDLPDRISDARKALKRLKNLYKKPSGSAASACTNPEPERLPGLVLLGTPGAGKTLLAARFVESMLKKTEEDKQESWVKGRDKSVIHSKGLEPSDTSKFYKMFGGFPPGRNPYGEISRIVSLLGSKSSLFTGLETFVGEPQQRYAFLTNEMPSTLPYGAGPVIALRSSKIIEPLRGEFLADAVIDATDPKKALRLVLFAISEHEKKQERTVRLRAYVDLGALQTKDELNERDLQITDVRMSYLEGVVSNSVDQFISRNSLYGKIDPADLKKQVLFRLVSYPESRVIIGNRRLWRWTIKRAIENGGMPVLMPAGFSVDGNLVESIIHEQREIIEARLSKSKLGAEKVRQILGMFSSWPKPNDWRMRRRRSEIFIEPKNAPSPDPKLDPDPNVPRISVRVKAIDKEYSDMVFRDLHYIHSTGRPEIALGMFMHLPQSYKDKDGRYRGLWSVNTEVPFSVLGLSRIDRDYKRRALLLNGYDPDKCWEYTRLYNAPNAPMNTSSVMVAEMVRYLRERHPDAQAIISTFTPSFDSGTSMMAAGFTRTLFVKPNELAFDSVTVPGKTEMVVRRRRSKAAVLNKMPLLPKMVMIRQLRPPRFEAALARKSLVITDHEPSRTEVVLRSGYRLLRGIATNGLRNLMRVELPNVVELPKPVKKPAPTAQPACKGCGKPLTYKSSGVSGMKVTLGCAHCYVDSRAVPS